ncbi:MAG: aspartate dehydrogenase [Methanomicrobiales archaeon]|nr:aspartate dehydrogenase [Methanomicrobiales archaeon]
MIRIGLLGCGNVGHVIAGHCDMVRIAAVYDTVESRAQELGRLCDAVVHTDIAGFIAGDVDLIVEAASVEAVRQYAEEILAHGKDLVILSVGALADEAFRTRLAAEAAREGRRIYIPSGAIIGLDNLKIGQISDIRKLVLRTTKSPRSLGIDVDRKMLVFKGTASDCIRHYPKNINVAVALELAAGREADVELWVDPEIDRNMHEVIAEGDFGDVYIRVRNTPSPDNPATSYLAALSVLTLLQNLDNPIRLGT